MAEYSWIHKAILCACLSVSASVVHGQNDERELHAVDVVSSRLQNALTTADLRIDSLPTRQASDISLDEQIQTESSVYVRSYGPGLASTISQHGFSPSQTVVYWNGLPLNSPALGLADLSTIPGNQSVWIDGGAGSTQFGSGYMGGGVHLEPEMMSSKGLRVSQSFQYRTSHLMHAATNVEYRSNSTHHAIAYTKQWGSQGFLYTDLFGEELNRLGADLDINHLQYNGRWRMKSDLVSWGAWASQMDRGIPRSISERYEEGARQLDDVIRAYVRWQHFEDTWSWSLQQGYYFEDQRYISDVLSDTNIAIGHYSQADFRWSITEDLELNSALDYSFQAVEGSSKATKGVNRVGGALNLSYALSPHWELVGGARLEHQLTWTPVIPSIHLRYEDQAWVGMLSYRSHFRFPTLNDLYWNPGGNPNLLPELGQTLQAEVEPEMNLGRSTLGVQLSGFIAEVENYILWVPRGGIFEPNNVRRVRSYGASVEAELSAYYGDLHYTANIGYSYTRSTTVESERSNDPSIGNQLIYTPEHQATAGVRIHWKQWSMRTAAQAFGEVHTSTDNQSHLAIDPFVVIDLEMERHFIFKPFNISSAVGVRNVTNKPYSFQRYYPMPGIQGTFSITIQFKHDEN